MPAVPEKLTWAQHVSKWRNCSQCKLCDQRYMIVLGKGQAPCDILLVGEAPGESEDVHGQPFVGPAGYLLDQIVSRSTGSLRKAYTNLVGCFPAVSKQLGTHRPYEDEIEACRPRLQEFIELAEPKLIVAVGSLAETYLPPALNAIVYSGGRVEGHPTVKQVIGIVHPAHILKRMPRAQQGMAVERSIVTILTAVEGINWG